MDNRDEHARRGPHWMHVAILLLVMFSTMFLLVDAAAAAGYGEDSRVTKNLALTVAIVLFVGFPTLIHAERRDNYAG